MSYVRPAQVAGSEYTLVFAQSTFPGVNVPSYGPFAVTPFNIGTKFVYVAVWDNRPAGSSPYAAPHSPLTYHDAVGGGAQPSNLLALTAPDQSAVVGPFGVTNDPAEYAAALLSGNRQLFLDPLAAGGAWPGGAGMDFLGRSQIAPDGSRSLTSVQEVFVWTPSDSDPGGGGGGGSSEPQECGPVPRPPWPYPGSMAIDFRSLGTRKNPRRISGRRGGPIELGDG